MEQTTEQTMETIRLERHRLRITGALLCARAGVTRPRLSVLEKGHAQPRADELARLTAAMEELSQARSAMAHLALQVGWPLSAMSL